jgi:RNA-directed DNA polymerase
VDLFEASSVAIKRHIKIRAEATPYDPRFTEYFKKREYRSTRYGSRHRQRIEIKQAPNDT